MKKLIAIGEALIDFIPAQTGRLQDVTSFEPHVGGAPCNVCGAFARLGGTSAMITQLGQDGFGDKIVSELASYGVDTTMIERTSAANTSLAFVALQADCNREFSFYRKRRVPATKKAGRDYSPLGLRFRGGTCGGRTRDLGIKSPLLYQLS